MCGTPLNHILYMKSLYMENLRTQAKRSNKLEIAAIEHLEAEHKKMSEQII